jgi:outer membrane protein TolC
MRQVRFLLVLICLVCLAIFSGGLSLFAQPTGETTDPPGSDDPSTESTDADNGAAASGDATPASPGSGDNVPRYGTVPLDADGNPVPLSMEQTIRLVLDNNNQVRIQQLEILKSDTDLLKDESQYAPVLEGGYQSNYKRDQKYPGYLTQGNIQDTDRLYGKVKQLFQSGTYFEAEVSDSRFDSNRNEGDFGQSITGGGGDLLRPQRPLHTGALTFVLRQELLKNAFGYNQRRLNDIYRNNAAIQRQNLVYELTGLVVSTMVEYWQLSIAEENVRTSEELLRNTRNIRGITVQKQGIGLAESFEVNQFNALLAQAEARLDAARLDRDSKRRLLLRVMNLEPGLPLTGSSNLITELPVDLNAQSDLKTAYETRPDFKSIKLQMENARKSFEIAENQLLPSVSVGGSYSSRDYGRHASSAYHDVGKGRYPDVGLEFKVEYPLWNESAKVDARNAKIGLRQLHIQEEQLRRQIEDEIQEGLDGIRVTYAAMQKARTALDQTRAFYAGLVRRYRQGRFNANTVKEALDALVQARQAMMEATINFNISLVRYDLTRNTIFTKYAIDIDSVIDRMQVDQDAYQP